MGSINTPLSITDLTVCSASLVYAAFARYNVPLKSDLRTRMQHWSGIICNIEGVWYSTIFMKSAGIWKGVSWLLTKMALSCLRELVLGLLFLWLSARWALHSPDNHQRIIFHALCLVMCIVYLLENKITTTTTLSHIYIVCTITHTPRKWFRSVTTIDGSNAFCVNSEVIKSSILVVYMP